MRNTGSTLLVRLAVSAALCVPCFWQQRIQAGDLSSHLYNLWLLGEIAAKKPAGLQVVHPPTNILFDLLLENSVALLGYDTGPKALMALLVLVFFWGAFVLIRTATEADAWPAAPLLAVLAYGWTFHMGFCNFHLSVGLSFFYLAIVWRGGGRRLAWGLPVLGLAATAHLLGPCWAVCAQVYAALARKSVPRSACLWLLGTALLGVLGLRFAIAALLPTMWFAYQPLLLSGADQAWVYGLKYIGIAAGFLYLGGVLLFRALREESRGGLLRNAWFHIALLTAAAVILLPDSIRLPQYGHSIAYVSQRLSLLVAVALCLALLSSKIPRVATAASSALAVLYFSFLLADSRALNAAEDQVRALTAQLPPRARVISGLFEPQARVDPLAHIIDRACIGRCYSYANYEASTWQFRIRALGPNPLVLSSHGDVFAVSTGVYVVKEQDGILYQARTCGPSARTLCLLRLGPGAVTARTPVDLLPKLW